MALAVPSSGTQAEYQAYLARVSPGGTVDPSFGHNGIVQTGFGQAGVRPLDLAVGDEDSIVVLAEDASDSEVLILARLQGRETCGNSVLDFGEECDDGNKDGGDCCSSTCQYEPEASPCLDADVCNGNETCDGAGTCELGASLECDDNDACTQDSCDPIEGCQNPAEPVSACLDTWTRGSLLVKETVGGKEKFVAKFIKGPALTYEDFGDPLDIDGSAYTACIYDDEGTLVESLDVDRAGLACGEKACWKALGPRGFNYKDSGASADGVQQIRLLAGEEGKSKVLVKAGNNSKKGQLEMPVGIAAALSESTSATVQLFGSDAPACFSMTLQNIKKQENDVFKAVK